MCSWRGNSLPPSTMSEQFSQPHASLHELLPRHRPKGSRAKGPGTKTFKSVRPNKLPFLICVDYVRYFDWLTKLANTKGDSN